MASAWVKVAIDLGGDWSLPSDSPGMLFRFRSASDEETIAAGRLKTVGDRDIAPGNVYEGGLFIEGQRGESLLEPGTHFIVWYANDVGWGEVLQRV